MRTALNIQNGASLTSGEVCLGKNSGVSGVVTVDGDGSSLAGSSDLTVGRTGSGTMNILDGATVSNSSSYISYDGGSTGTVTVDGDGSTWTNGSNLVVGRCGQGTLNITNGGEVSSSVGYISVYPSSTSVVTVDGNGSTWTNSGDLYVGRNGQATLNITNSGTVSNSSSYIGNGATSTGVVTIYGSGSTWTNNDDLHVGRYGQGTLNIINGGLVNVAGTLTIDYNEDGDSFINMASGGMLALNGDADDSLASFLGLIYGTYAIRYWDDSASNWADITGATYGEDYTLAYLTEGDLTGYTVLTVTTVPEPASATILLLGTIAVLRRRKK